MCHVLRMSKMFSFSSNTTFKNIYAQKPFYFDHFNYFCNEHFVHLTTSNKYTLPRAICPTTSSKYALQRALCLTTS